MTPTKWMTKEQAAAYLQVHPETIRRLVVRGALRRNGTGKLARYRQDDLDEYLTGNPHTKKKTP